jgi:hypothetical protein
MVQMGHGRYGLCRAPPAQPSTCSKTTASPPLTTAPPLAAMLDSPPVTAAHAAVAPPVLPPVTDENKPVAEFSAPPLTDE